MAKYLSQVACLFGVALFVGAFVGVIGETDLAAMQLASEPPAAEQLIALSREDRWDRSLNSASDAIAARKSETTDLAQRHEHRAACRSVRHERCDE
jgi:hypothetical protein